jgi:glycosyltransferase involved in cell wall biosynthesis
MKIVHILLGKANPNRMIGVNKVVHSLATEQRRQGVDVEVWGITSTPESVSHTHEYRLRLFKPGRPRLLPTSEITKAVSSLEKNTVVHFHSVFVPELYAVSRVLKKRGVHWVLTPHSGYNPRSMAHRRLLKKVYWALFESKLIKGARAIHAIGASEKGDIQRIVPGKTCALIPNGQDLHELEFPWQEIKRLRRPVFGYCGRLVVAQKGLDLLLEAFSLYLATGGTGELWLVGDGPDRGRLERTIRRLGLGDRVRLLGAMFGSEKLNRLAHMDVFVHTSRWDVIPTAVLEAAGLGRPLLLSRETNLGESVEHHGAGVVLSENSAEKIASAMETLSQAYIERWLDAMGTRARNMIEREFSWTTIVNRLHDEVYA